MTTCATQFTHFRLINLMFDHSLNGGQLFVTTPKLIVRFLPEADGQERQQSARSGCLFS
jgi:hypothetical protein